MIALAIFSREFGEIWPRYIRMRFFGVVKLMRSLKIQPLLSKEVRDHFSSSHALFPPPLASCSLFIFPGGQAKIIKTIHMYVCQFSPPGTTLHALYSCSTCSCYWHYCPFGLSHHPASPQPPQNVNKAQHFN